MDYIELNVSQNLELLSKMFPPIKELFLFFSNDPDYIVRIGKDGKIEIGYESDPEWQLSKKPPYR